MTRKDFRDFRRRAVAGLAALGERQPPGHYDEQGLPAYTNPNLLMRQVFWQRIRIVIGILERLPKAGLAVDFGSGLGLMIPILADHAREVVAVEVEPEKLVEGTTTLGIAPAAFRTVASLAEVGSAARPKADLVLALDVLEHVGDLDGVLQDIFGAMAPDGRLLVSGPTENALYRLGRRLAGYSGRYHRRSVGDIERALKNGFRIVARKVVYPPVPLFVVLEAVPAPSLNRGRS
jgi:predicted TPR repeat methyltransferase